MGSADRGIMVNMSTSKTALLLLSIGLLGTAGVCRADSILGVAAAYNLVALGNGSTLTGSITDGSDVGGRVAAAGTVNLPAIGQSLVNDPNAALAGGFLLVAAGGVTPGDNIHVMANGNLYAAGATSSNFGFNTNPHGSLTSTGPSPIDFGSLRTSLDAESAFLGTLAANGQALVHGQTGFPSGANPSWLALVGSSTTENVFNLTAAQLSSMQLDIVVPAGSTVLINVSGTAITLNNQININGNQLSNTSDAAADVLFNFDDATTVALDAEINGTVLAPLALVTGNQEIAGTLIAAQINDSGEVDNAEYTGNLPSPPALTPEPSSLMLFGTGLVGITGLLLRKKNAQAVLARVSSPRA
jgi:choice-of-anchor A domain-containing protein